MNRVDWLIIDWGTTNFRAFAMQNDGVLIDKIEKPLGLLQVADGQFAIELESTLKAWLGEYQHLPVYMAGMVGSAQGWVDVPYVAAPVTPNQLAQGAHQFVLPWGANATIIPGVSYQNLQGDFDVMRGEEVQLFGLQKMLDKASFTAVLPGTHSKHVNVEHGELTEFRTYMTGEMFSVLAEHSILGRGLPQQVVSEPAFLRGIEESGGSDFTAKLFAVRTHRLFGRVAPEEVLDYLSGLLIGQELKNLESKSLYLVGGEGLCQRYQIACDALSIKSQHVHGDDAFLVGMRQIKQVMSND
ncbi:2-dehydro-3-deoxygalactonokinase [Vibrio paucivorans]